PEAGSATAVIAGDEIGAHSDEISDVETLFDIGDEFFNRRLAWLQMQIARARRRRRRNAALSVSGRLLAKLAGRGTVQKPGGEHAIVDNVEPAAGNAFGIEGPRALAAFAQWVVDDANSSGENFLAELVSEKAGLAGDGCAIDRASQVTDQGMCDPAIEHHRHAAGRGFHRVQPLHRALAGDGGHRDAVARAEIAALKSVARHQHHAADAGGGRGAARLAYALDRHG